MAVSNPTLSLVMIVKNESRCLARCLQSVKGVADEIILTDTGSADDTVAIATQFGAVVSNFAWVQDFSAARNFALAQATRQWILIMDADEWLGENLGPEILSFIRGQPAVGLVRQVSDFRRDNQTFRSQSIVPRIFPRNAAHYEGRVHEQLISPLPRVTLRGDLLHDGYVDLQKKGGRNLKLLLAEVERDPNNVYFLFQLALEYNAIDQPEKAFEGLWKAFALMKSGDPSASSIAVDLLYTIIRLKKFEEGMAVVAQSEKFLGDFPDFFLVRGLFFMNLIRSNPAKYVSELPKIEQSFLRCLELGEDEKRRSVHGAGTFLANYNLGVFYQVFRNLPAARRCFATAASQGYEPAAALLKKISNI